MIHDSPAGLDLRVSSPSFLDGQQICFFLVMTLTLEDLVTLNLWQPTRGADEGGENMDAL